MNANDHVNGIPRVDPTAKAGAGKRAIERLVATRTGTLLHRTFAAPIDAALIRATRGRVDSGLGLMPLVVLTSTGARSGQPRDVPLTYFTDGDDVVVMASSYGRASHPSWYYNLLAHPECELRTGRTGGRFVASRTHGAERDRLYALAIQHYVGYRGYADHTDGIRTIPVLRLSPAKNSTMP